MADVKISALPLASTPLAGTEVLPIVQSATTDQVSVANLTAGRAVSAASLTLTTPLTVGNGGTGTSTAFTAGSVVFAGTSGVYSQNNSGLFWDNTNSRLGIGTATPVTKLDVAGSVTIGYNTAGTQFEIYEGDTTNYHRVRITANSSSGIINATRGAGTPTSLIFQTDSTEKMRIASDGSVGIGTTSPAYGLHLSGTGTKAYFRISNTSGTYNAKFNVEDTGEVSIGSHSSTNLWFLVGNSTKATIDTSGNLGLGVTPSAWASVTAFQIANSGAIAGNNQYLEIETNTYYNAGYKYISNGLAAKYGQEAGKHVWYNAPNNTSGAGATIAFTQVMTLDASGNLGLGNTANERVGIFSSTTNCYQQFVDSSNGGTSGAYGFFIGITSGEGQVRNKQNSPVTFFTNNTERARIDASGNLLVGKTSTSSTVVGVEARPTGDFYTAMASSTSSVAALNVYSTGAAAFRFYVDMAGNIYATNTVVTGISDRRLKENIVDLDVGLNALLSLKPRKFDWKDGKGKNIKSDRGWIADEFQQVFPDLIDDWKDTPPDGEEPYKAVRPDLMPVIVKAIQELAAKVAELEAKI